MKNTLRLFGFLAFTMLLLSSCSPAEKKASKDKVKLDMAKVKAEIQALEDAYAAGQKAEDASAVATYYSEDAMSYSQNEPPLSGRAAIEASIAERIAKDTTDNYSVYKIVDLYADGNSAVEIGSWTQFDPAGKELDNGNYMSYFEKRDGKYVCVRDMSTTATPLKKGTVE